MTAPTGPRPAATPTAIKVAETLLAGALGATVVFIVWPNWPTAAVLAACLTGAGAIHWHTERSSRPARHLHAVPDCADVHLLRPPAGHGDGGGAA